MLVKVKVGSCSFGYTKHCSYWRYFSGPTLKATANIRLRCGGIGLRKVVFGDNGKGAMDMLAIFGIIIAFGLCFKGSICLEVLRSCMLKCRRRMFYRLPLLTNGSWPVVLIVKEEICQKLALV